MKILLDKKLNKHVKPGFLGEDTTQNEFTTFEKRCFEHAESIVKQIEKALDSYGFEIELINDYEDYDDDYVGMFLASEQNNSSVFPIVINPKVIYNYLKKTDDVDNHNYLVWAIKSTLWHEVGHGIVAYLSDVYDFDWDEEEVVEEFARIVCDTGKLDGELIDALNEFESEYGNINESFADEVAVKEFADDCRVDNLPVMDYKEFSQLLKEHDMHPTQELYKVYVDRYNSEDDIDYIGVVTNKFENMSSDDIIKLLGIPHSNNIDTSSPMFILPNGAIISVANAAKLIDLDFSSNIHSDMVFVILSAIAKKLGQEWTMNDKRYEDRRLDFLTYGLDWARINTGTTWLEDRFYCVLPNHMTSAQYRSLEKWLEWGTDNGKEEVLVYVGRDEVNQTYYFDETFPEDIIKKVKRYYSSGRLYENRNEMKESMNIHPQVQMQLDYLRRNAEDKYNKGSRREYENIDNYKWYQKEIDTNGDKNLLVKGKLKDPYQFRDMFGVQPFARRYKNSDLLVHRTARGSEILVNIEEIDVVTGNKNDMNEEFVNELVPGELYHFIHNNKILYGIFKKKTPAWLFFDVEGKEVLAKPWTNVATTTEELEEIIGVVNKMEKDTKIPSQVPNRFTRVPNQHGKPMGESNELTDRAKRHKKKSKGMGWHMAVNAGDVEKGMEVFNRAASPSTASSSSSSSGEATAMGESVEKNIYHYDGPVYYRGHKIAETSDIYTTAKSINVAIRNTLVKASQGADDLYNYDIVDHMVKLAPPEEVVPARPRCQQCGYELNDIGDCPVCDYGEDDLLESLSDLEALWTLSNLD